MALVATHVWTDRNMIVYLLDNTNNPGTSVTIPAAGGATPDLVTDGASTAFGEAASAALRRVVRAGLDGLGTIAAAGFNQAQARNLYFNNGASPIGGPLTPRANVRVVPRTGAGGNWRVDADVSAGRPTLVVGCAAQVVTAYLYVELEHSLAA